MRVKAFKAWHPTPERAEQVSCLPYDVVETEEARQIAAVNSRTFLRVVKPEIEFAPDVAVAPGDLYRKSAEVFKTFQRDGLLVQDPEPGLYVYREQQGTHVQRGVVVCCHAEDYEQRVIRRHELTRADKEEDRAALTRELRANAGLVFLAYRRSAEVEALVAEVETRQAPMLKFKTPNGVEHTVWRVARPEALIRAFEKVPACYIADGHHRAAAAVKVAAESRAANPRHDGTEDYNWFLGTLLPADQLRILPYNRCVADLNGLTPEAFLQAIAARFTVRKGASPAPASTRNVSVYLRGQWHGLTWDADPKMDAVSALDVSVLQDRLLAPVLGIQDPRRDKRIEFVGGFDSVAELTRRVDSGRSAVAFSMHPVTVEQMMNIADEDRILPPKSTWFEPKLLSGLVVRTF